MRDLIEKLRGRRKPLLIGLAATAVAAAGLFAFYLYRIDARIAEERGRLEEAARVEVREARLRPPASDGLTIYVNAAAARDVAVYRGVRYLATAGGLVALTEAGDVARRYTTADGLPDNGLTALAVFQDRLFIGTASAGLLAFDGEGFTGYAFTRPKAARVSALLPTETELLVGTLDGGLFEFDGRDFTRRLNSAPGADFSRVTALLARQARLYIGTQDRGLYVWREGQMRRVAEAEGLPSPHVTGLAPMPEALADFGQVAVATDFGVVGIGDDERCRKLSEQPNVTSLAASGGRLWAGMFGGGIREIKDEAAGSANRSALGDVAGLPAGVPARVAVNGGLWALTERGAFVREETGVGPRFDAVAARLADAGALGGDHITALATDGAGRLWIGYFDGGIDVLALETGERLTHLEDDRLRQINFIARDPRDNRLFVATSRGLVIVGAGMAQTVLTRERDALAGDAVAHVLVSETPYSQLGGGGGALVLATSAGLTELAGGRARSITAFHGLPSNYLYTSALAGSRLFVGSLAGLAELEPFRVVRTYKTSNSRLSHDWVTALAVVEGGLFIGTNGGGVDALLPTGEWVNFADQIGKFEVNQNAFHFDGERLFVGTSDRGLLIYNTRARRWSQLNAGLSSLNVTAISSDERFVYLGTLNGLTRIEKRVLP